MYYITRTNPTNQKPEYLSDSYRYWVQHIGLRVCRDPSLKIMKETLAFLPPEMQAGASVLSLNNEEVAALIRAQACDTLRENFGIVPGSTVYTTVTKVSSSGMSRHIRLFVVSGSRVHDITRFVAEITGWREANRGGGLVVSGCGMDMGFHTVYTLGRYLFPEGASVGRGGRPDTDGGYALKHEWL